MSNVAIKLAPFLFALSVISCSGNGDKAKAEALLTNARNAVGNGDYAMALALTDSIKRTYPKEIDIRREALHVAATATEGLTVRTLESADSTLAVLGVKGDSLSRLIKFVQNPVEGYYVGAKADPAVVTSSTGIQARVSPDGQFYILSYIPVSKGVKSTSVSVGSNGKNAHTSTIEHDGERNDRSMGTEIITFMGVECDDLGRFLFEHRNEPVSLTFNGAKSFTIPLPSAQAEEIATMYEYSMTVRDAKIASIEKERLTRALEIARSQSARTFVEKDSVK